MKEVFSAPSSCRNYRLCPMHVEQSTTSRTAILASTPSPTRSFRIFVLLDGRKVDVARGWGPTRRDLIAAGKASSVGQSSKPASTDLVKVSTSRVMLYEVSCRYSRTPRIMKTLPRLNFCDWRSTGACTIFSTVLGPEVNDVHRTHFHLDLQDRGTVKVCQ